jgi:hypothetical protein
MSAIGPGFGRIPLYRRHRLIQVLRIFSVDGAGFALSGIVEATSGATLLAAVGICSAALLGYAKRVSP